MKAVGPVHKTEVGGVSLDVRTGAEVTSEYERLGRIEGATGVLVQPMLKGVELFLGAKWEPGFGHVILCGLGGIFVEALNDVASGLAPLDHEEALDMIRRLRGYPLVRGVRGQPGVDEDVLADLLCDYRGWWWRRRRFARWTSTRSWGAGRGSRRSTRGSGSRRGEDFLLAASRASRLSTPGCHLPGSRALLVRRRSSPTDTDSRCPLPRESGCQIALPSNGPTLWKDQQSGHRKTTCVQMRRSTWYPQKYGALPRNAG